MVVGLAEVAAQPAGKASWRAFYLPDKGKSTPIGAGGQYSEFKRNSRSGSFK